MDKSTGQETNGDVNPMKANSLSENVKFDLEPRRPLSTVARTSSSSAGAARADGGGDEDDGGASDAGSMPVEMSMSANPSKEWELDVRGLVSTRKWLQNYGLKKNRMDLHSVLPQIGFKHADEYDQSLKKPVCSRYANGVFPKQGRADGKTFNVASSRDKVKQLESRLLQAIALYKRRLDWLTSESRRIFGVIEEKSVTIVMDIINMSPKLFRQYRTALERVIKEQVTLLAKFNMIRATEDMNKYADECVAVTSDSVEGAINWMWSLDRTAAVSPTATCEAVVRAVNDVHTEAVYLYTEGSTCDGCRELLKEKLTGARVPVHVVSINCDKADTIAFLKDLTKITGGKFHAYAVTIEMDSYEAGEVDDATNQANIILKKKTFGGVPPGAGVREDVIQLFEELEEARNTLMHLQEILDKYPEYSSLSARDSAPTRGKQKLERSETYMSSREWLAKHGLKPKKLGFYDVLAGAAFKHRDGVVDVKHAPAEEYQTDAIKHEKLVNAKYCDLFPCVRWKNGEVVHVQVTPELHRVYEQRINMALTAIKQRIDWLQQGSRELFGTVIEDKIYILIDTSASMKPHLEFVKDKLFILMQEQLRHKQEFNLIAFDSRVSAWRDRLIDVNEKSLRQAWQWIRGLMVSNGSTNTMAALRAALADHKAEAIYLLTDGRPDQPPKSMLAQVQLQPQVPIHTISFNCSDREANEFLCQLAKDTQGRFHYYSESGVELEGPEPWESEDIRLLRLELETGQKNLEKVTMLRDKCSAMAWRRDDGAKCASSQGHISRLSLSPRSSFSEDIRPSSAPGGYRMVPTTPMFTSRPATASCARPVTLGGGGGTYKHQHARPATAPHVYTSKARPRSTHGQLATKPLVASHTRTSLLRSINNNGLYISPDWLLPETRQLFERQWARQQLLQPQNNNNIQKKEGRFGKKKSKRSSLAISSKKWLSHHGLAAKKLTILDALSPTFIPHEPKFVPILNKHVLSKVFDDLLPIAHASGQRQKIRIVNPQGVDLKKYEEKVEKAIDIYTRRLDRIVWNALPQTEKESFGGEGPVSVEEERHKVMEALDRSGWPIEERNIILLENEIKQARLYIKQAQDLLAMSTVSGGDDGAANSDSGSQSGSSRDSEAKNYHPNSAKLSNRSRSPPSEKTKKAPPGKVAKAWSEESQMPRASKVRRGIGLHAGQKVIARNSENGFYYPGSIKNIKDSRNAVVRYAQLGTHIVPARFIIPVSGAISRPTLQIGDYTLCRVINEDTEHMCYVPGVIQTLPRHDGVPIKFYTVQLFTGHTDLFLQQYLIKINKIRYTFLVRYIKERILEQCTNSTTISKASSVSSASRPASASSRPRNPTPSSKRHKKRVRIKDQHHCTPPRSRSTSTTRSRSCSGSTSLSRSRSRSTSRSRSPPGSRPRSRSSSRQSSRSTSKSRSNSRSGLESEDRRSRSSTRSDSSASLSKDDGPMSLSSCNGGDKNEQRRLKKWMDYLQRQQKRQRHAQKKLNTQIAKLKKDDKKSEDHRKLLQTILEQLEQMVTPQKGETSSDKDERIQAWIQNQNSSDNSNAPIGQLPPVLVELRDREKPKIGEEVLARWMDEGWYYAGTILEDLQDNSFLVKDGAGDIERIWREDVICDDDDKDYVIKPEDAVIALHPTYDYSYAPAVVKEVESDMYTRLQFYDGEESRLPREQVYHIPTQKYKMDVTYIVQCESQWVGQAVVARNDHTGTFHLAAVRKRVGNGRQYMIEWSDGQLVIQNASCMFGAFTKRHSLALGDCVLAIQDHNELMYLPGVIQATNDDMLVINFCDNSTSDVVAPSHCFWLSKDYYSKASDFYSQLNSKS